MKSTIESAVQGLEQTGASVEAREVVKLLARHSEEEEALLEHCVRAIAEPSPPALTFVVRLIVEDERRHHRLLAEVANSIAWGWIPGRPPDSVPEILDLTHDPALSELTKDLLRRERQDRKDLRRLRKALGPYRKTTLWALIMDIMALDTTKHVHMLEFIARRVR